MRKIRLFVTNILLVSGSLAASETCCVEESCGSFDVFADFLYWRTTEVIDWASILQQEGNLHTTTFKTLDFDFCPGFRVGVGYNNHECNPWDTQGYYTYFRTKTSDRASPGFGEVQSEFLGSKISLIGLYQTGAIDLKLDYNMFDWELGYTLCACNNLSLRPMIGVKGGWIDQTIKTKWEKDIIFFEVISITATEDLKNDFWGVGPKGGVNGQWILGGRCNSFFSLFGDVSAAFMWGHWVIKDEFDDSFQTTVITKVKDRNFGALMLQGAIGLRFDYCCPSTFSIQAGYEIEDWLNHYQIFDNGTGGHSNELILQGFTLRLRLDF